MRKWGPLLGICLGAFMLLMDVTITTVAMPAIGRGLHASFTALQWVLDGYALALAALMLGAGSLADLLGRRAVYLAGVAVFAAASLTCALAPSGGVLVAARVVQGAGGAAMFATTVALITATYDGRDRGIAFGVWGAVNGGAAAAGPLLGGVLVAHVGWRAIFWVNLPIAVVAAIVTAATVRESRNPAGGRVDVPGMVAFTAGTSAIVYALSRGEGDGWTSPHILGALAGGLALLVIFALVERRTRHPMLDPGLFRGRSFTGIMLAALIVQGSAFGYLVYTSLWLQFVLRLSAVRAGLALVPLAVTAFVVSAAVGRFLHGRAPGPVIAVGALLVGAGAFAQAGLDAGSSANALLPGLVVAGVGVGLATPVLVSAAMAAAPPERAGMAGGAVNTVRQFGFAVGVALFGTVFQARAGQAPSGVREAGAFATGLDHVYVAAGIGGVAASVLVVALVRGHVGAAAVGSRDGNRAGDAGRARL